MTSILTLSKDRAALRYENGHALSLPDEEDARLTQILKAESLRERLQTALNMQRF